jgi:putative phage-type endonuclease
MTVTIQELELPAARLLLPHDAPREQWLEARQSGLGASDMSTIAGVNPFKSTYELWLDKTGRAPQKKTTRRMQMGNILEPVVRAIFEEETGLQVLPCGLLESVAHPFLRCTPDGIIPAEAKGFEAKTTSWRNKDEWESGEVADHAEVQSQASMAVTGLDGWYAAAVIDGNPDDFHYQLVHRNQGLIDTLIEMAARFWHDHVLADVAPPITALDLDIIKLLNSEVKRPAKEASAGDVATALAEYRAGAAAEKAAKAAKEAAQAKLISIAGDAEIVTVDGEKQFTYKQTTRKGYVVADSTYRTIYVPKQKG